MKLDYIENINAYGENVVRLYDFNMSQAILFRKNIQNIITNNVLLKLSDVDFIESRNCNLTMRISEEDLGILSDDKINFFCDLTIEGYNQMITLLEPFCKKETKGYQWLYDVDTPIDFLFSPAGTW